MRIYLLILIIVVFGVFGYEVKRKYIEQKNVLIFLKSFIEYLRINTDSGVIGFTGMIGSRFLVRFMRFSA